MCILVFRNRKGEEEEGKISSVAILKYSVCINAVPTDKPDYYFCSYSLYVWCTVQFQPLSLFEHHITIKD